MSHEEDLENDFLRPSDVGASVNLPMGALRGTQTMEVFDDDAYLAQFDDILDMPDGSVPSAAAAASPMLQDNGHHHYNHHQQQHLEISKEKVNIPHYSGVSVHDEEDVEYEDEPSPATFSNPKRRDSPSGIRISPRISQTSEQLRKLESALEHSDNVMRPLPIPTPPPPLLDEDESKPPSSQLKSTFAQLMDDELGADGGRKGTVFLRQSVDLPPAPDSPPISSDMVYLVPGRKGSGDNVEDLISSGRKHSHAVLENASMRLSAQTEQMLISSILIPSKASTMRDTITGVGEKPSSKMTDDQETEILKRLLEEAASDSDDELSSTDGFLNRAGAKSDSAATSPVPLAESGKPIKSNSTTVKPTSELKPPERVKPQIRLSLTKKVSPLENSLKAIQSEPQTDPRAVPPTRLRSASPGVGPVTSPPIQTKSVGSKPQVKLVKRHSLLDSILSGNDSDEETSPGIRLAPQMEQRMLEDILVREETDVLNVQWKFPTVSAPTAAPKLSLMRTKSGHSGASSAGSTVSLKSAPASETMSEQELDLDLKRLTAAGNNPRHSVQEIRRSGAMRKLDSSQQQSRGSIQGVFPSKKPTPAGMPLLTPSNSTVSLKKPVLAPLPSVDNTANTNSGSESDEKGDDLRKHRSKDNYTIKGLAKIAKKQIKKMAVQALIPLVAGEDKELEDGLLQKLESNEAVEQRKTMVRERLKQAASFRTPPKKVDARFEPNKPRVPEKIGKIPLRRVLHWEQMLAGIYNEDFTAKSRDRIGRPVRKLSDERKLIINDIVAKRAAVVAEMVTSQPASGPKKIYEPKLNSEQMDAIAAKVKASRDAAANSLSAQDMSETKQMASEVDISNILNDEIVSDGISMGVSYVDVPEFKEEKLQADEIDHAESEHKLQALIDHILADSPSMTELNMQDFSYFQQLAVEDPQRKMMEGLLAEAIALNTHFKEIVCSNCALSDAFITTIAQWAKQGQLVAVQRIDLSGNLITEVGVTSIAESIADGGFKSLKSLILKKQQFPLSLRAVQLLSWSLRANFVITEVAVDSLSFDDDQYEEAMRLMKSCVKRNKGKDPVRAGVFLTAVEERIRSIVQNSDDYDEISFDSDFMFRLIPEVVKVGFASSLQNNTNLKTVKLTNVELKDDFALAFANSLVENNSIEVIDLSGNFVSTVGFMALVEAVAVNRRVKQLTFMNQHGWLGLSPDEENAAVLKLKTNKTLIKADLPFETPSAKAEFHDFIQQNCLRQLQKWK
eukprot:TRINITY_DN3202_c0_g1_i1.p1 TRINITY_DN3202_c0_g1~~TRINITY_DN3202_c0_g1_i1.p1  ORF type:complete len:1242 (-),score=300.24 TRINITY_DN3202_c0_g1_i1:107-3832(-)